MKTFSQKTADVNRRWILIDAKDAPLGRLSTEIAKYLIGKYKPTYTPHVDGGDYVIVINAAETVVTGAKETDKIYYRHSGFPGGIKDASLKEVRENSLSVSSKTPLRVCFLRTSFRQNVWHDSGSLLEVSTHIRRRARRK